MYHIAFEYYFSFLYNILDICSLEKRTTLVAECITQGFLQPFIIELHHNPNYKYHYNVLLRFQSN